MSTRCVCSPTSLDAIVDEQVPVGIEVAGVTGLEPAIGGDRLLGLLRHVPVALHDVVAADGHLADVTLGHLGAVVVDDAHFDAVDRQAN